MTHNHPRFTAPGRRDLSLFASTPPVPTRCHPQLRAALYFFPPSQGEGTEGGGGCDCRSPAQTCAGTFTPTTPSPSAPPLLRQEGSTPAHPWKGGELSGGGCFV